MASLTENIRNRVDKLPKPSNYAQALQPVFEAISNAKFAIYDRFESDAVKLGKIIIIVENLGNADNVKISVHDNGVGMDQTRYDAFCMVDTDYKKSKGGKGVGRLFWLDAFKLIRVDSRYGNSDQDQRAFNFILRAKDQVD